MSRADTPARRAQRRVQDAIRVSAAQSDQVITLGDTRGRAYLKELAADLRDADEELQRRLRRFAKSDETFSAASMAAYQQQIARVRDAVIDRLNGQTTQAAQEAARRGLESEAKLLAELDEAFTGIVRPLRLAEASVMSRALRASEASILGQRATSVDRYGTAMIERFETIMRRGLIRGATQREMALELGAGPAGEVSLEARETAAGVERLRTEQIPEGLFTRYRSWAVRIVRTEVARAYTAARIAGLEEQRQQFPELQKKILATFDNRTAPDSVGAHGQIRALQDPFRDGAGRVYQYPPARPNDRETVIPWMPDWPEGPVTRPIPPGERQGMARARDPAAVARRLSAAREQSIREQAAPPIKRLPTPARPRPKPNAIAAAPGVPSWYEYDAAQEVDAGPELTAAEDGRRAIGASMIAWEADGFREDGPAAKLVRQGFRGWLRGRGILSRDVLRNRPGRNKLRRYRFPAAVTGWAGQHAWDGTTSLSKDVGGDLGRRAGRALARGVASPSERRAVHTMMHEELHGASPMLSSAYQGAGKVIEEAGVELSARRFTAELTGEPQTGAYDGYISDLAGALPLSYVQRHQLASEAGFVGQSARRQTADVWLRLAQRELSITSPDEYMDAMARHLDGATDAERREYRNNLTRLKL